MSAAFSASAPMSRPFAGRGAGGQRGEKGHDGDDGDERAPRDRGRRHQRLLAPELAPDAPFVERLRRRLKQVPGH
jgi:hypothetical protein